MLILSPSDVLKLNELGKITHCADLMEFMGREGISEQDLDSFLTNWGHQFDGDGAGAAEIACAENAENAIKCKVLRKYKDLCFGDSDKVSPLVLDLDGDGVETGGFVFFDHAGEGFAELSAWASEDDGVLVIDLDGNGAIDSGAELFGDNTMVDGERAEHGFAALVPLDSNSDGLVNSLDDDWGELRVFRWVDGNNNGFFDQGEGRLETLAQHGIESLSLEYETSTTVDSSGNEHRQAGSYTKTNGAIRDLVDVWFKRELSITRHVGTSVPVHSGAIAGLPEVKGAGLVHDLRDAMALDATRMLKPPFYGTGRQEQRTLAQLVTAFKAATEETAKDELLEKILHRWTGAEAASVGDYWSGSYFAFTTPQKMAVVEAFRGSKWLEGSTYRHPALSTSQKINRIYQLHFERLRAELLAQTTLKDMFDAILVTHDGARVTSETDLSEVTLSDLKLDFSDVLALENAVARKGDFLRSLTVLSGFDSHVYSALESASAEWAYEFLYQTEYFLGMVTDGVTQRANDFIGDDTENTFRTTDGGNDHLRGAGGSDIYQLGRGTGHDVIEEDFHGNNGGAPATDVVQVAPGIASSSVTISREAHDLMISLVDSEGQVTDSLRVRDHFVNDDARIERLEVGDGTVYTVEDFADAALTRGDGTRGSDRFDASLLSGALGETQRGGRGSDTYLLGRGTGHESIDEASRNHEGSDGDAIRLKAGLVLADVRLSRHGADLKVGLVGSDGGLTDSLTIKGHYLGGARRVEFLDSSDGTRLLDLLAAGSGVKLENGATGGVLEGLGGGIADTFGVDAGSDTFRGKSGDDVYCLGLGSGTDYVEEGHQNRMAGDSADTVRLGAGVTSTMARMRRTMWDLVVELIDTEGEVTDSLTVRDQYRHGWAKVEKVVLDDGSVLWSSADIDALSFTGPVYRQSSTTLRGTTSRDYLYGNGEVNDIFDSDAGGNDHLYGHAGDDEYRLGSSTGSDVIDEGYRNTAAGDAGDLIKIVDGFGVGDVQLRRDGNHLFVELLGTANDDGVRAVTDSLKVHDYYHSASAKVETVEFADGTVWDSDDFHAVAMRGGIGNDYIYGRSDMADIFDSDAGGNDHLYGHAGDDEYRLGSGTGADVIDEGYRNTAVGDAGDLIKIVDGFGVGVVQLRRDGNHLFVELLGVANDDGVRAVTDSLKVKDYYHSASAKVETVVFADGTVWDSDDFHAVALRGGIGNDYIYGRSDMADIFDSDAGGNDHLYGHAGDDEYRLGSGTGSDVIDEGYRNTAAGDAGDLIKIVDGFGVGDVQLRRDGNHLFVELLGTANEVGVRAVTDSLKVKDYYHSASAKVETVEFADGTVWDSDDFHAVALRGGIGNDYIYGRSDMADIFDSDAGGNDHLYGYAGDDEYRLGSGTGADVIDEGYRNTAVGDAGDLIKIVDGFGVGDVRLRRDGNHLFVELLGTANEVGVRAVTDSLKVKDYYHSASAKVETVEFADGTVWDSDDFHAVAMRGGIGNDYIYGRSDMADIFDSDAGGNDHLYGYAGDDEYRLGSGTGSDVIDEGYRNTAAGDAGDLIKIVDGFGVGDVQLRRDGNHLFVELLGVANDDGVRAVTDSLKVKNYYVREVYKVETVEFADGTVWDGDFVVGTNQGDIVTSTTASETLHGGEGDDTYVVSGTFGDDRVVDSGGTDKIQVSGHTPGTLSFARQGDDMVMGVIGSDDRAIFDNWYAEGGSRKVERIEAGDKVLLSTAAEQMATAMATFVSGGGTASDFVSRNHQDYWETLSGTPGS